MKKKKAVRTLFTLLCVAVFMVMLLGSQAFAAFDTVTLNATLSPATLNESSSEQTVTLTLTSAKAIDLDGLEYQVIPSWDGATITSTAGVAGGQFASGDIGEKNGNYYISWSTDDAENVTTTALGTFKITVPANTKANSYTVRIEGFESTKDYGDDGYQGSAEATLTITGSDVAVSSISLNKTSLSLETGKSETLKATVKPDNATDKTVTWSSSNEKVATVSDGKVTAAAAGSATITATAGGKSATCKVTVTEATVAVTSVTVDPTTLSLAVGGSETLTATVKPDNATDKDVTWKSSKTSVATVDKDGKVTAVAVGSATITATAGGKSATCKVTVTENQVPAESVSLDKQSLELKGGESATLKATVTPSDSTDKVAWSSSNEKVAKVDSKGKVTAVAAGSATITAKAGEKSATCTVTVAKGGQEITAKNITATYGDTGVKIGATVKPSGGTLTYEVTKGSDVISVDKKGAVTIIKAGTATVKITAAATDSMDAAEKEISVTINKKDLTITAKDKTAKIHDAVPELGKTDYTVTGLVGKDKLTKEPTLEYATTPDMSKAGTVEIKVSGAEAGDNYTITYKSGKLTISDGSEGTGTENKVTPAKTENGTVTVSPDKAKSGDTVTVTAKPDSGYELGSLQVLDKNGKLVPVKKNSDGTYSFTMPDGPVSVLAVFQEANCPSKPYKDVDTSKWYHEGIDYAIANGLMKGVAADKFDPNGTLNRAMLVTILYRLDGSPAVSGANPYSDVESGSWYDKAVQWADANKIVNGYGDGTFGPEDNITREQMAAMLYRYAQFKGYNVSKSADLSGYTDASAVSSWALDAMKWANGEGLIQGRTTKTLVPQGTTTRAEAATILMRFCENVK